LHVPLTCRWSLHEYRRRSDVHCWSKYTIIKARKHRTASSDVGTKLQQFSATITCVFPTPPTHTGWREQARKRTMGRSRRFVPRDISSPSARPDWTLLPGTASARRAPTAGLSSYRERLLLTEPLPLSPLYLGRNSSSVSSSSTFSGITFIDKAEGFDAGFFSTTATGLGMDGPGSTVLEMTSV